MRRRFRFHPGLLSLLCFAVVASLCEMMPTFFSVTFVPVDQEFDFIPDVYTSKTAATVPLLSEFGGKQATAHQAHKSPGDVLEPLQGSDTVTAEQSVSDIALYQTNHTRIMEFIPRKHLGKLDYFSATWIQPMSTFLKLNTQGIETVEAGVFRVWRENTNKMRMTLDWMDFSIEHLSKFWKNAQIFAPDPLPYKVITSTLERYIENAVLDGSSTALQQTIAVIAFQPYGSGQKPVRARNLTVLSLAATLASMMQAGFGRILVVGYEDGDSKYAHDSFILLDKQQGSGRNGGQDTDVSKIGNTEVGYVFATLEEVTSKKTPINRVKGALTGLQHAVKGDMEEDRRIEWLGTSHNASFWKYVYLTEPDTILQFRSTALPQLKDALDKGLIIAPHRLQPLPHESDLKGMKNENKFLPATGNFETVVELNPLEGGVCCDELGEHSRPWQKFERCGSFWWQCGFNAGRNHSRLEQYQLVRLRTGTGFVNLAGTEHGRRCIPNTSGTCELTVD